MATVDRHKITISFWPNGDMLFHYMNQTDPFTDSDRRNFIELVKMPEFEYTADGNGNYYNLAAVSALYTEGLGTIEGEIWISTMLHGMDADTFRSIKEWRTVG